MVCARRRRQRAGGDRGCLVRDPRPREPDQRAGHRRGDPPGTAHRQRRSGVGRPRPDHRRRHRRGARDDRRGRVGIRDRDARGSGRSSWRVRHLRRRVGVRRRRRDGCVHGRARGHPARGDRRGGDEVAPAVAVATLTEADGGAVTGATITFLAPVRAKKGATAWSVMGTATTDSAGVATFEVPGEVRGPSSRRRCARASTAMPCSSAPRRSSPPCAADVLLPPGGPRHGGGLQALGRDVRPLAVASEG